MNRILFSIAALLGALMPLVFDSALKGAALLAIAALTALAMWRASAAARHLVWLVAVVALLVVPVLSVALPQWRVLPGWAAAPVIERATPAPAKSDRPYTPYEADRPSPPPAEAPARELPSPALAAAPEPTLPIAAPGSQPAPANLLPAPTWRQWLPFAWCIGFAVLAVRLLAAHLLLRRASRHCPALTAPPDEKIAAAFAEACKQLGITQRVVLLLDQRRTIPVVWGVFRPRLMLPIEARTWSDDQLRSVLLHELAHIKRRDTLVQWLTQIACALHWWNPLVWLAAWRLHAERERACDDLVLASGVRPSAYAEHLLDVATRLSPARWTSACGLAMARKSSLEGRLMAVLSEKLNRNGVTRALAIAALVLGAAIALPVAMLRAADEKPRDGMEHKTDKASAWVRSENGKPAYIIFSPFKWNLRVSDYYHSNEKEWNESCEITLPGGEVADLRVENPAPKELTYRKTTYDFTKGRVFVVRADATVRQLDIPAPLITKQEHLEILSKQIQALPPEAEKAPSEAKSENARVLDETRTEARKRLAPLEVELALLTGERRELLKSFQLGHRRVVATQEKIDDLVRQIAALLPLAFAPGERRDITTDESAAAARELIATIETDLALLESKRAELQKTYQDGHRAMQEIKQGIDGLNRKLEALHPLAAKAPFPRPETALAPQAVKVADDQYVKSGIPLAEVKDVVWNGTENGLSLGYRIIGDEWRILGKQVKVELWLRNIGNKGVKFQSTMRPDIGLRMKLKNERGEETKATIVPNDTPPFGELRLLPPGHALKVKDFPISLFRPANDVSGVRDHYFGIDPGAYEFHCELELPGFSATGEGGKQLTPAEGEWTGKLTTRGVNVQVVDLFAPKSVLPKNQYARAHFAQWQKYARANGDIPGGLVALLDDSLARKDDPKLKELRKRLDGTRDWPAQEAADFLDALAATGNWLDDDGWLRLLEHGDIEQGGKPLPPELASLPWGTADDSTVPVSKVPTGLRAAFTLDPAAASYAQGTRLPVTIHYHNSGTAPVVFPIGFCSMDMVEARDSQGRKVFTTVAFPDGDTGKMKDGPWKTKHSVRLEPGQWISVTGAQLTIADGRHPFTKDSDGNVLMAQPDSTVMLKWLPMTSTWRESQGGEMDWKQRVEMAVARFSPMPKSRAERESIIRRVMFALFGEEPTAADVAAFAADDSVNALAKLTSRLQALPKPVRYGGWLKTGERTFKVTPAAADYRGTVMATTGSGVHEVDESVILVLSEDGGYFEFSPPQTPPYPPLQFSIAKDAQNLPIPHGLVWRHGSRIVWLAEKARVRKLDLTVPGKLTVTEFPQGLGSIPRDMQREMLKAFPAIETAAAPVSGPLQPITDGKSSAQVLQADGQEQIVIITGRALGASRDSSNRAGAVTMDVGTTAKTATIGYTWPEDAPGFLELKAGDYPVSRFDLSRGRVFFVHFEKLEFSADIFQVPAAVKVPTINSPETLTQAATAVNAWYDAADDRARWECSRVVVPESEYKSGQPLDAAVEKIVWGEANEAGLRLGLGGLASDALYPVGQLLPVKQYVRNDGAKALTFSPTQVFSEGVDGELTLTSDGKKFAYQKGYRWQMFFDRVRLAPGHYIALQSGPLSTTSDTKGGGFAVQPGEYTLQLTHGIGQFLGRPTNARFGDPRLAPGLGEWTGVLKSAALPLRLADEQIKTAKAGEKAEFGTRYTIAFDKGVLKLRHYNGYPQMSRTGDPWEAQSRDWKIPAADGEYVAAWAVGGQGLWIKDATGITHLVVKDFLTENGKWTPEQAAGEIKSMPAGVRTALQLPAVKTAAAAPEAPQSSKTQPKHESAQSLFRKWQESARTDGKIPGGLIAQLARTMEDAVKQTNDADVSAKLAALRPRLDASRDWTQAEAVAVLDEVAELTPNPLSWAAQMLGYDERRLVLRGKPLPQSLESAPWGKPAENGLRAAWLLEPRASEYPADALLKARVLFHNTGKAPVVFQTDYYHRVDEHRATDSKGTRIPVKPARDEGEEHERTFQLAPGEFCEVEGVHIAVATCENWEAGGVTLIEAKPGDEVTLSHTVEAGWDTPDGEGGPMTAQMKQATINRLALEAPLPRAPADRELLIRRVTRDLTGKEPTTEEIATFSRDDSPDALEKLGARLQANPVKITWSGSLETGETKFRVLPALPSAPRSASKPGEYVIGNGIYLRVSQDREGDRHTNKASIERFSYAAQNPPAYNITLPEGLNSYCFIWERGSSILTIVEQGSVRTVDFSNPSNVQESRAKVNLSPEYKKLLPPGLLWTPGDKQKDVKPKSTAFGGKSDWEHELVREYGVDHPPLPDPSEPLTAEDVTRLTKAPAAEPDHLKSVLLRAAATKDRRFRFLLNDPEVAKAPGVSQPLNAYEFSINGSVKALDALLEEVVAASDAGGSWEAGHALAYVNEWERSLPVMMKHNSGDGAGGEEWILFWLIRSCLFHGEYVRYFDGNPELANYGARRPPPAADAPQSGENPKTASAKLTPDALLGAWRGTVNGEKLMLSFHRPPAEKDVQCDIYFGEATIGALAGFTIAEDGSSAEVVQHSAGGGMKFGTLIPSEPGKLKLELYGRQKGQQETMLTRDEEPSASEPQQKEARELFDTWKRTANADGTIPGTFIGQLATDVRAYVKAHPTLDSAAKMPKLLPRFDTRRAWTQAEAIALLDDVAYYSTKPIEARVAKAKLPSGPMWRTMVEFQDIPVKIEKWSEPLRGLRMGMHIAGGEWRTGGKVRVELWLHNAGEKDVEFSASGPDRADGGLTASATDADGREHWAVAGNNRIIAIPMPCVLPAGHAAMVKGFDLPFTEGDASRVRRAPEFIGLKPGKYQLRCSWLDAAGLYEGKEWKGSLTAPEFPFTLGGAAGESGEAKPGAKAMEPQTVSEALNAALAQRGQVSPRIGWAELEPNSAKRMEREVTGRSSVVPPTVPPEPTASGYNIILQDGNRPSSGEPFPQIEKMSAADLDAKIAQLRSDWEKNIERWVPAHPRMKAISTALDQLVSEKGRRLPAITRGRLVNEAGKPLGKRIIFIVAPDYKPGQTALQDGPTNEDGTFQFEIPVGKPWQALIPREGTLDGPRSREFIIEKPDANKNGEPEHELNLKLDGEKLDAELKSVHAADSKPEQPTDAAVPNPDARPKGPLADAKPQQARDWNDKYAAVAYHTADDVNFVLIHEGVIATGLSESWAPDVKRWAIEGNIHLVDSEKTKAAGKNVDKRVIPLKHTSDAPGTLSLDGRDYDLKAGRVFILRDDGAPEQLDKTMPLRDKPDLEKLGGLIKNTAPASVPPASGAANGSPNPAPIRPQPIVTASAPGRYMLGGGFYLVVFEKTTNGVRTVGSVINLPVDYQPLEPNARIYRDEDGEILRIEGRTQMTVPQNYTIDRAQGGAPYAFAWVKNSGVLWFIEEGILRRFDLAAKPSIKETKFESKSESNIPAPIDAALSDAQNGRRATAANLPAHKDSTAIIKPSDVLDVLVEGNATVSRRVSVGADGKITIKGFGTYSVGGMSFAQAEESLHEESLKLTPQNGPRQIFTISYATGPEDFVCYLIGEFQNPRTFMVPANVPKTALAIIEAAGGASEKGDLSAIEVRGTLKPLYAEAVNSTLIRRDGTKIEKPLLLNTNRVQIASDTFRKEIVDLAEVRAGKKPDIAVPQRGVITIPSIEDTRKLKPGESFTLVVPPPLNYTDVASPRSVFPKEGMKLTVNADGKLIDPAFGTVDITGRMLKEVRKELLDRMEMRRKTGAGMSDAAFNALWDDWQKEQRTQTEKPMPAPLPPASGAASDGLPLNP